MLNDEQIQSIGSMSNVLKKYAFKKNSMDINNKIAMSSPSYSGNSYTPFIKHFLAKNVDSILSQLKARDHSKYVANATVGSLVDYCADVQNSTNSQIFNLTSNSIAGTTHDNCVTAIIKNAIDTAVKDTALLKNTMHESGIVLEEVKDLTDAQIDTFINKINKLTPSSVNTLIANKVTTATKNFIEDRNDTNETIKDIYRKAALIKNHTDDTQTKAQAEATVKREKYKLESKPVSVIEAMVTALAKIAMNDTTINNIYKEANGDINIDALVEDVQAMYAVLETANTYNIIKFTPELIEEFLKSFE